MTLASFLKRARAFFNQGISRSKALWMRYRSLRGWQQIVLALVLAALLIGGLVLARGGSPDTSLNQYRTVTLASIGELSGNGSSVGLIGTVRSITEANILAQTSGTVRAVHASLGSKVPAGFVIAELENAAERAVVLQAEGSYEAALAARSAQSLPDAKTAARDTYRTAFTTLDSVLENSVDTFFGGPTPVGPDLLFNADTDDESRLSRERSRINARMNAWESALSSAETRTPETLLEEADAEARGIATFLNDLAAVANRNNSTASDTQLAALATARASVNTVIGTIATSRASLRTGSVSATLGADASVKQALGALRGAQANLERTVVRAPLAGTLNFLPIRVGEYVTSFTHVATVAQNGALEIVAYVSEDHRDLLAAGGTVTVEETYKGVLTSIAPALDPITKQIEVHVAVTDASNLVNGQSVRISLPDILPKKTTAQPSGPLLLPLSSVKLRASDRIIFEVGEDSRLIARPVEVGDVRGDRIEIRTPLPTELRIVADARGLSEGEQVTVASTTY